MREYGFGINRLVYCRERNSLVLASRLDGIVRAPSVTPSVDPRGIANFLNFGVNLAPGTIFLNIEVLSPGTMLISLSLSFGPPKLTVLAPIV